MSKYKIIAFVITELTWIQFVLKDIGFTQHSPLILWCNSLAAMILCCSCDSTLSNEVCENWFSFHQEKRFLKETSFYSNDQIAYIFTNGIETDIIGQCYYLYKNK